MKTGKWITQLRRCLLPFSALAIAFGSVAASSDASASRCLTYAYDGPGNRTAGTTSPEGQTWGSANWGCLRWTP